jgi:uncharacterized protein YdhG (YjbR/CyaY superfamily)
MDQAVRDYIEAISPQHRPLFDRLHRLVIEEFPTAQISLSYKMPVFIVGTNRLFVGVWKKWVSLYGWDQGRDAFAARHPELRTSKGTLQLSPGAAAGIPDDEFRALIREALG